MGVVKHQTDCYRIIKGRKYINFADLIMGDEENFKVIGEATRTYPFVKRIKHHSGEYYQLFVAK